MSISIARWELKETIKDYDSTDELSPSDLRRCDCLTFILANGRPFKVKDEHVKRWGTWRDPRWSFQTAYEMVMAHPNSLTYCEGVFAHKDPCSPLTPVIYALVLDAKGRVIFNPASESALQYFAVPFDIQFVTRMFEQVGQYGVIENAIAEPALLTLQVTKLRAPKPSRPETILYDLWTGEAFVERDGQRVNIVMDRVGAEKRLCG